MAHFIEHSDLPNQASCTLFAVHNGPINKQLSIVTLPINSPESWYEVYMGTELKYKGLNIVEAIDTYNNL
jgi:hypothetical protein